MLLPWNPLEEDFVPRFRGGLGRNKQDQGLFFLDEEMSLLFAVLEENCYCVPDGCLSGENWRYCGLR